MKKDVNIKIKGTYIVDGERSVSELFTAGSLCRRNDHYYITYQETETTGFDGCVTTVKIESPERITLTRRGNSASHLVLQKGTRNVGQYNVMGNLMEIGVYADVIDNTMTDQGGSLKLKYSLDMNSSLMSENELEVSVTEA